VADEQGIDGGFRHILDAITDVVYVTGPDRTIVYRSAGAERITGYTPPRWSATAETYAAERSGHDDFELAGNGSGR
jgi:PAS domain-containing protein